MLLIFNWSDVKIKKTIIECNFCQRKYYGYEFLGKVKNYCPYCHKA